MRFICINCGAKEYIIGGKEALCLTCWTPMVKATDTYAGIYLSPSTAIRRFNTAAEKHGYEKALTGRCKQEREAWIAAAWALCMQQETGRQYWIEIETVDQTPDCKVHYIDQSEGHNHRFTHNLEIVEWDHHRPHFMDLVRQKCAKGGYPPYFTLVVLARNGKGVDFPDDLAGLHDLKIPFSEMWLMGRASPETTTYSVCMFHPGIKLLEFDLEDALQKNKAQIDFLHPEGRGSGTEFRDRGVMYMPIKD
jgi:uncharacterized protein YndB with AHSA1/START domain